MEVEKQWKKCELNCNVHRLEAKTSGKRLSCRFINLTTVYNNFVLIFFGSVTEKVETVKYRLIVRRLPKEIYPSSNLRRFIDFLTEFCFFNGLYFVVNLKPKYI